MDSGENKDGIESEAAEVETAVEQQGDGQEKEEGTAPQEASEVGDQPPQGEQDVDREQADGQTAQSDDVQTAQGDEPKEEVQTADDQNQQDGEGEESPKDGEQQQQQQQEQSQAESETRDVSL